MSHDVLVSRPYALPRAEASAAGGFDDHMSRPRWALWVERAARRRPALLAAGWLLLLVDGAWLTSGGDPIGPAFVLVGLIGLLFLGARVLQAALWIMVVLVLSFAAANGSATATWEAVAATILAALSILPAGLLAAAAQATAAPSRFKAASSSPEPAVLSAPPRAPEPVLRIQTIGRFQVCYHDRDLTDALLRKPVLAFIWMYLLARAVSSPGDAVQRRELAEEVNPGFPTSERTRKITGQIYDLQHDLPPELAAPLRVDREHIRLDLTEVDLDVIRLQHLEQRLVPGAFISAALALEIEAELASVGDAEFLPPMDVAEERIGGGRGTATRLLGEVRRKVNLCRGNLALALSEYWLSTSQPKRAIILLETVLCLSPEREDAARLLVTALLQSGQSNRATDVRRERQLTQEA
ncbi:MAG TPA: hypothetical protein VMV09_03330 [Candidatus Saccharimonadales bacterium]|nr:hypothetical protein [Candidatus Saccharimonadales bacterium]